MTLQRFSSYSQVTMPIADLLRASSLHHFRPYVFTSPSPEGLAKPGGMEGFVDVAQLNAYHTSKFSAEEANDRTNFGRT